MKSPTLADLDVLVMWPPGTVGEAEERELVATLLQLCVKHGYGRVPQVASQIRDLWDHPERRTFYEREKHRHLKLLEDKP